MNTYYEILGLKPGASPAEIKKAYFKMIRKHSPESDPEQFQKIREAYEHLKNTENSPEGPVFPPINEPFAKQMMAQIEELQRQKQNERFQATCEEAWNLFPQYIQFLYLLVISQRLCGNTGKSVKSAELLVKLEPDNKWFQMELAFSYLERGYTKKAFSASEKAYELGCRNIDFLLTFSNECHEFHKNDTGISVLLDIIHQDRKWSKDELPDLFEAYYGLFGMSAESFETGSHLSEILDCLYQTLEQYRLYIPEYIYEICMMMTFAHAKADNTSNEYKRVEQIFSVLRKACSQNSDIEQINGAWQEYNYQRLVNDGRFSDTMIRAYDAFFGIIELDPIVVKFALLDTKLCMIEERTEILEQAEILKKEYPDFYEKMQDFLLKLENPKNLNYLKDSLLKTYRRLEPDFSGGYYYKKYPHEQEISRGTLICDGMTDEPYVRTTKKVGRNDPCPCGSGKKYKQCCMRLSS